jgi:TonB family protein
MSKALTRLLLALVALSLCAHTAAAQEPGTQTPAPTPEWVAVSPEGEEFAALMPKEPLRLEEDDVPAGEIVAGGQRYTATAAGGARYVVWSLLDRRKTGQSLKAGYGASARLDLAAEVAWQLLVKPEYERLELAGFRTGERGVFVPGLSYVRMFERGGREAREYTLRLEKEGGPVYIAADGARLYIAAALAPDPSAADSKRFVESLAVGAKTPNLPKQAEPEKAETAPAQPAQSISTGTGTGFGPGRGSNVGGDPKTPDPYASADYNRPFRQNEVTKKALITFKPEPGFTESARKFNVAGVVRLRAVLSKTGEMTNLTVVKGLPHGLTDKAFAAARQIRFEPAQKDGQAVSQYVVLEYNFNIY